MSSASRICVVHLWHQLRFRANEGRQMITHLCAKSKRFMLFTMRIKALNVSCRVKPRRYRTPQLTSLPHAAHTHHSALTKTLRRTSSAATSAGIGDSTSSKLGVSCLSDAWVIVHCRFDMLPQVARSSSPTGKRALSYGRGIRKGTQGSVLAWRAASLLLGRLLLLY